MTEHTERNRYGIAVCPTDGYLSPASFPMGEDSEGNEVGAIAPWDTGEWTDGIVCGSCGGIVLEPWTDPYADAADDDDDNV